MKYARCANCRSEIYQTTGDWKHVYSRSSKDCILKLDEDSIIEVQKW